MKAKRVLSAISAASLCALWAPAVHADANGLSFVINDRPARVPAVKVRWSFALNAAPVAGVTSVSISGVTATLGGGWATVATPSGNDRFRLDATTALTNGVTFQYEARSHFTMPDLCKLKAVAPLPAFPKAVTLNFSGPTITHHAIVTYTVSGNTEATTINCVTAKRRVNSSTAGISVAPPGAVALSRHPLDVVLVLDKSGSMGWELPGAPFGSLPVRWTVLGTALEQFEALWEQAAEADVVNDRIGLVHFDSGATGANFAGSIFKKRGSDPVGPAHDWNEVLTAAKAPAPGGSTAIGKGLNLAFERIVADPANIDAVVVLMTDGEQNVDPEIQKIAGTDNYALRSVAPFNSPPVADLDELYLKGIPIQTIAMGTPADPFAQLLDGIAAQTAGTSVVTTTAAGMSAAMQDVLLAALKGNTLGLLARTQGTVTPPNVFAAPVPLELDASVRRATVVLNWTGRRGLFEVMFQPPGGGNPIVPTMRKAGANWLVASVDLPANGPSGTWQALVKGQDLSAPAGFQLSAYALDGRLKYSLNFGRDRTGTADSLPLFAELSYDGKPLDKIAGGVRVSPARPGEGLGNILHKEASFDLPNTVADQSVYTAKVAGLARTTKLLDRIGPKTTGDSVVLSDDGAGGDATAQDGIYTGLVPNTRVPGRYRFDVVLEWDDPRTGKVRRVESVEREVVVVADPQQTPVVVTAGAAPGSFVIQVTPRDRFGNYMGPGYAKGIQVRLNGAGTVGVATDPQLSGVYSVQVTNATAPTFTLTVDNTTVWKDAPLAPGRSGPSGPGTGGKYAIWLALGRTFPHGSFNTLHDSGFAGTLGVEYALNPGTSIEGTLATHRFKGTGAAPDIHVTQLGVNGKWYFGQPAFKPFVTLGAGAYAFSPGSTRFGLNAGAGVQFDVAPRWSLEGRYAYHAIAGNAPNSRYSTVQLGVRYSF